MKQYMASTQHSNCCSVNGSKLNRWGLALESNASRKGQDLPLPLTLSKCKVPLSTLGPTKSHRLWVCPLDGLLGVTSTGEEVSHRNILGFS